MSNQVQLLLALDEAEAFLARDDVQGFITHMNALLQQRDGSNFMVLVGCINSLLSKVPSGQGEVFIIKCLDVLHNPLRHQISLPPISSGLPYLLLESVPLDDGTGRSIHARSPDVQAAALDCFNSHCEPDTAKVALRLAQLFGLTLADLQQSGSLSTVQPGRLIECIDKCRQLGKPGLTSAIGLLKQFKGLEEHFDCVAVLSQLVESGQDGLAQSWVSVLSPDLKATFIHQCMAADRYKSAKNAVHALGLQDVFPDVEKIYRQRTFARLTSRGLWSVAATFAGNDKAMQESLVRMTALHDLQQADLLRAQFGLPEEFLDPAEVAHALAENEALRADTYLMLDVPPERVLIVDSREHLETAAGILGASPPVIGIDVEWRPTGGSGRASLMQVATLDRILLFDLFTLGLHKDGAVHMENLQALDACLGPVLHGSSCLKVGFELMGDLKMLANSWPMVTAFQTVHNVFEMRELWIVYLRTRNRPGVVASLRFSGLSTLSQTLLGRPLDKSMQISDWEQRPMTARQVEYAAQDAHVLVRLFCKLQEQVPNASTVVAQYTTTFSAAGGRASRQQSKPLIQASSDSPGNGNASAVGAAKKTGRRDDDDDDDGTSGRGGGGAGEGQVQQGVGYDGATGGGESGEMQQEGHLPEQCVGAEAAVGRETTRSGWGAGVESGRRDTRSMVPLASVTQHAARAAAATSAGSSSTAALATPLQQMSTPGVGGAEGCVLGHAAEEAAAAGGAQLHVGRGALEGLPAGVRQRLESVGLGNSVIRLPASQGIATAADAARTLGSSTSQVVKSMALILAGHAAGQAPSTGACSSSGGGGSGTCAPFFGTSQSASCNHQAAALMPGDWLQGSPQRQGQEQACKLATPLHAHHCLSPQQEQEQQQQADLPRSSERTHTTPHETQGWLLGVSGDALRAPAAAAAAAPADVAAADDDAGAGAGADAAVSPSCLLAVLQGDRRLDLHKVAIHAGLARKHMRVATAEECVEVLGCAPGTIPPFAVAPKGMQVVVDKRLVQQQQELPQVCGFVGEEISAGDTRHEKQQNFEQQTHKVGMVQTRWQGQKCDRERWDQAEIVKQQYENTQGTQPQAQQMHDKLQGAQPYEPWPLMPRSETSHSEQPQQQPPPPPPQQQQQQQQQQQEGLAKQHHANRQVQQQQQQQQQELKPPQCQTLFCGAGTPHHVVALTAAQLLMLSGGRVADIAAASQPFPPGYHPSAPSQTPVDTEPGPIAAAVKAAVAAAKAASLVQPPAGLSCASGSRIDSDSEETRIDTAAAGGPNITSSGLRSSSPKFLCDSMLGRLCRWLRAMGVDTELVGQQQQQWQAQQELKMQQQAAQQELKMQQQAAQQQQQQECQEQHVIEEQQAQVYSPQQQQKWRQRHQLGGSSVPQVALQAIQAAATGRVFLTRDTRLASRRDCVAAAPYLLSTDDPAQQLREVSRQWGLTFDASRAMSRCSNCNAAQFMLLSREEAATMVPPKVFQIVDEFYKCGACSKTFWMGPKSYSAVNLLEGVLGQQEPQQGQSPP